ncbi:DUF5908 family protein [Niastella vici]|uniref:DUF5908 family protein n=1 Tax=Niastella vici TaxID=1703345 RepID=UPI001301EA0A|nr:DUF5908 family protein [Niastella vici]
MPLVIKELHIKITINQPAQAQQATAVSVGNEGIGEADKAIISRSEGDKEGKQNDNLIK